MFSEQPEYKLVAIPFDYTYGHYLTYFKAGGTPCGAIDYERKLTTQNPRETVSLCMIAKDSEHTLGQTLSKIKDVVDEIHIVVDEETTDKTAEIAEQFGAKISRGKSPMEVGFAAARNESLKAATCDWVLWVDADEHFERTENLSRYLRRSLIMGFGIPQHHFSEEPPGILKTDFPCRLFRNHRGVQFFGYVHEHPELTINEGVGKVSLVNDLGIMHFGYVTENIRRERFRRNWPLMVEDFKINPNRVLGQFLWMRGSLTPTIPPMRGYFLNAEHVRKFSKVVNDEAVKIYEEKYF
jgi:glycosyltransferase involved in cell wall biosynthesis